MKTFFTKHSILFFFCIIVFSIPANAVIDYKPEPEKKTTINNKKVKAKKRGLLKRWKERLILKRLNKEQSFERKANLSLILGISSLVMAIGALLVLLLAGSGAGFVLAAISVISSIIGSYLSWSILKKTKDSKKKYRKERRKAKWVLGLSLSTVIVPALLIIIILLVVLSMYG